MTLDKKGRVLVGGTFTTISTANGNATRSYMARLLAEPAVRPQNRVLILMATGVRIWLSLTKQPESGRFVRAAQIKP